MNIVLNGKSQPVEVGTTLESLIEQLDLGGSRRLAVELNEEVIPRSRYAQHRLRPGDQVEIVHAIGGG